MLVFTGCYLVVGYTLCLILYNYDLYIYGLDLCMPLVWLSFSGLSLPLILATLLVKMLRVYHIFMTVEILKQSAKCKDYTLLVYIALVLLPQIILLTLRTAINPSRRVESVIEHHGVIEIGNSCDSDYSHIWYGLSIAYLFLLFVAILAVAVKSRKIRDVHFKDTKKVNLLIFLLTITGTYTFSYWYTFYYISINYSFNALYIGHMLGAFLCQITLFLPKVWPSVQKKIIKQPRLFRKTINFFRIGF